MYNTYWVRFDYKDFSHGQAVRNTLVLFDAGSRFVERMLSIVATSRQQNRNVLELLTACCRARLDGSATPSLLPAEAGIAAA